MGFIAVVFQTKWQSHDCHNGNEIIFKGSEILRNQTRNDQYKVQVMCCTLDIRCDIKKTVSQDVWNKPTIWNYKGTNGSDVDDNMDVSNLQYQW